MAQLLIFETPVSVNATFPVNITWNPRTFNSANYGNFTLNLWLLRADSTSDAVVNNHAPSLLAHNQSVFTNFVLWTPTLADVDVDVPEAGTHQLAWEEFKNDTGLNPSTTAFEGFSQGFHIKAPASSSASTSTSTYSSTSSSISSSTASSVPSQTNTSSPSTTSRPTILGLSIGLGLLLLIFIGVAIWGVRKYRRIKKRRLTVPPKDLAVPVRNRSIRGGELDGVWVSKEAKPVELPGRMVAEM